MVQMFSKGGCKILRGLSLQNCPLALFLVEILDNLKLLLAEAEFLVYVKEMNNVDRFEVELRDLADKSFHALIRNGCASFASRTGSVVSYHLCYKYLLVYFKFHSAPREKKAPPAEGRGHVVVTLLRERV